MIARGRTEVSVPQWILVEKPVLCKLSSGRASLSGLKQRVVVVVVVLHCLLSGVVLFLPVSCSRTTQRPAHTRTHRLDRGPGGGGGGFLIPYRQGSQT